MYVLQTLKKFKISTTTVFSRKVLNHERVRGRENLIEMITSSNGVFSWNFYECLCFI